ncbi:MAG: NTP transferase domain-containing protein [Clostridia bacterium]|nr:NTP transferase domain-containing protein [Clostridia bacterium]
MKVKKALILAAGKGTRFLPYTKAYPKEMLAVVDKPALQLIVEEVAGAGITDVMVVISPEKKDVVRHFTPDPAYEQQLRQSGKTVEADSLRELANLANVSFVYQPTVTGTGKAVELAKEWANGQPFAVLNGDDVIYNPGKTVTAQLVEAYEQCQKSVIGVQLVEKSVIGKYASCQVVESNGRLHKICNIVEKPQDDSQIFSLLAPLGRYVVSPDIFDVIAITPATRGGEVYLTDSFQIQAKNGGIYAYEFQGKRHDFGDKFGYVKGFTEFALQDPRFGEQYLQFLQQLVASHKK